MQKNYLNCPVEFVVDVFGSGEALAAMLGGRKTLLVADSNVVQHTEGLGLKIGRCVNERGIALAGSPVIVGGGEKAKMDNFQSPRRVIDAAIAAGIGPDDAMLVLGGGSVIDAAGYAAAQIRGGVPLVFLPTTPAAMMDGAFLATAHLNVQSEKDALGLPVKSLGVIVDVTFARTILDGVWRGGVSEAVRMGAARDAKFLDRLSDLAPRYAAREEAVLDEIVRGTLEIRRKKGPVPLGLAAAAELEVKSSWKLPHGYAVAIGTLEELLADADKDEKSMQTLVKARDVLKACGALDGLYHSRNIISPELTEFLVK